ncbi:MAG TPA: SRPBCC domain-containing protein [Chryseolinea sp.]|nr:SRPBCC domain-containing protein [Chryseolinea sp.]
MNLLFDFTVEKATNTIHITREFAADLDLVWDAFTKAEMLDQWMGLKPWGHQTKEMDFREGGRWLHAMISPENVAHWSLAEFIKIEPKSSFITKNSFCDENGNPKNTGFTFSLTTTSFKAGTGITTVQIAKKMANLSELEQFTAMGHYKEGTAVGMRNLDEYLLTLVASK